MIGRAWQGPAFAVRAVRRGLVASLGMLLLISPALAGQIATVALSRQASPDGNGHVDVGDYNCGKSHFGEPGGGGSAANAGANAGAAVPEPAADRLIIFGILAMCCGRHVSLDVRNASRRV